MIVDIDAILNRTDGWDLSLNIGGRQFAVNAPPELAQKKLKEILAGEAITAQMRPELEKLIAPMISDAAVDITSWPLAALVGATTAIAIRAMERYAANTRGIVKSVAAAMKAAEAPKPQTDNQA